MGRFLAIALLLLAALDVASSIALGQERSARIVYITGGDPATRARWIDRFKQGMQELGHREGPTYGLETIGAKGRFEDLPALVRKALDGKPDVILVSTTPASLAVKAATSTVPIVFVAVGDPLGIGLVDNMAKPGGNVTGLSNSSVELPGKRLQLLAELIPSLKRVAVLVNPDDENANLQISRTREAADRLQIALEPIAQIRNFGEMEPAYKQAVASGAQGAVRMSDPVATQFRPETMRLASAYRLPTIYAFREDALAGGLIAYGSNQGDLYNRAAYFVSRILAGTPPGELPVEQPTRFEFVINLKAARELGMTVPDALLARADEIID
jgi:putative ABC transport system substrate-binding protein